METEIIKKVSDEIMDIIFEKFSNIKFFKKRGENFYKISIRTMENVNPKKVFDNMVNIVSTTKEKTNIINFDKDNFMNVENGCIFDKHTFEIKGYE